MSELNANDVSFANEIIYKSIYDMLIEKGFKKTAKKFKKETKIDLKHLKPLDWKLNTILNRIHDEIIAKNSTTAEKNDNYFDEIDTDTKGKNKNLETDNEFFTPNQKLPTTLSLNRIDNDYWLKKSKLKDNLYKPTNSNSFIDKDAALMKSIKGKEFRKVMTKKKKNGWKANGRIEPKVNSYFFNDSD